MKKILKEWLIALIALPLLLINFGFIAWLILTGLGVFGTEPNAWHLLAAFVLITLEMAVF